MVLQAARVPHRTRRFLPLRTEAHNKGRVARVRGLAPRNASGILAVAGQGVGGGAKIVKGMHECVFGVCASPSPSDLAYEMMGGYFRGRESNKSIETKYHSRNLGHVMC